MMVKDLKARFSIIYIYIVHCWRVCVRVCPTATTEARPQKLLTNSKTTLVTIMCGCLRSCCIFFCQSVSARVCVCVCVCARSLICGLARAETLVKRALRLMNSL